MMDWSDRHCRYFWRLLTQRSLLYTEMVTTGALLNGDVARFLQYNQEEHPVALQLGGSDPEALARCAEIAQQWGYDEVNLNCGCPSDRVQEGKIGAVLMTEPDLVADCVRHMRRACDIPITVKHRVGVDDQNDYPDMLHFVDTVAEAGCERFIVHARKAWLKGLSPKENREIPPLNYAYVQRLKAERPHLRVVINGGITNLAQCETLLKDVDGVMIGREAYHNPYFLAGVDAALFADAGLIRPRRDVLEQFAQYCEAQINLGQRLHHMSRHILGLYAGEFGARIFRRHITEHANAPGASPQILMDALHAMEQRPQTHV
ncbi:tRNA-dihydrouridine synthase A [Alteromonadaceae bacterium 2753L.S.0a.02]|nr:tRNA-dihydrouridine synthase A [Alteromonadaceae bacterium 2753L.S.0a.02]